MDDNEINARVAGIEGWKYRTDGQWWQRPGKSAGHDFYVSFLPPPYATDWAWVGPLILKYRILLKGHETWWYADCFGAREQEADTPQRAICLAVIAAHEGK